MAKLSLMLYPDRSIVPVAVLYSVAVEEGDWINTEFSPIFDVNVELFNWMLGLDPIESSHKTLFSNELINLLSKLFVDVLLAGYKAISDITPATSWGIVATNTAL